MKPAPVITENRRINVIRLLMESYQLTEIEAQECAERGGYSYVRCVNIASADYFEKKKARLYAGKTNSHL